MLSNTLGLGGSWEPAASLLTEEVGRRYLPDNVGYALVKLSTVRGTFSAWDPDYKLARANELTSSRPWNGVFRLVAVYLASSLPMTSCATLKPAAWSSLASDHE